MEEAPDLGRLVSLIMENPSLIAEISALANNEGNKVEKAKSDEPQEVIAPKAVADGSSKRLHRSRLIGAMKPYLSEERQRAVDTMLTIVDILDAQRGGV